jgi:DNA-binding NtrC family response regulator
MAKNAPPRQSVISVGNIHELLILREAILKSVGYTVFTTSKPQEAAAQMRKECSTVLLICYSVAREDRQQLINYFREHCPSGRIIGITNRPVMQVSKEVDELVYGIEGPEVLLDAIRGKAA